MVTRSSENHDIPDTSQPSGSRRRFEIDVVASAAEFLERTRELRSAEPVLTNVIGSVATGVVAGRRYASETWLVVREGDRVVGCAIRTAPWPASLSPMPPEAAVRVGAALAASDPDLRELAGPAEIVRAALGALGDPAFTVVMRDIVRVLGGAGLVPPRRVTPGAARVAGTADVDLLTRWLDEFAAEAGLPSPDPHEAAVLVTTEGRMWLWDVDGTPVAMAGHAPTVETPSGRVGRIGPVYTRREHRRRGYGEAATRTVAERLRQTCETVMLYADADNADSNSVYAAMGFEAAGEVLHVRITALSLP